MNWLKKNKSKEKLQNIFPEIIFRTGVSTQRKFICENLIKNYTILDLETTKINCNFILYVLNWFWLLNIITWIISMLKIQHVSEIKKCSCVPKAQITFIRSYVNRYSWWNKSCDSRFTQLSIEAWSIMKGKPYYFYDLIKYWFFIIILRVIIYIYLETFNARFHTSPYTSEFYSTLIHFWTFNISQIITVTLNNL